MCVSIQYIYIYYIYIYIILLRLPPAKRINEPLSVTYSFNYPSKRLGDGSGVRSKNQNHPNPDSKSCIKPQQPSTTRECKVYSHSSCLFWTWSFFWCRHIPAFSVTVHCKPYRSKAQLRKAEAASGLNQMDAHILLRQGSGVQQWSWIKRTANLTCSAIFWGGIVIQ